MTETSGACMFSPNGSVMRKIGSCGVPMSHVELKIADEEGDALPTGHVGEMLVRGPQNMMGYHKNDEATNETLTDDGWLRTGDVGYYDEEGFVYIVDRMKELIKVKGLQVSFFLRTIITYTVCI
jgi:long-subunit acyl-CoA synthetase (AMP-forming)